MGTKYEYSICAEYFSTNSNESVRFNHQSLCPKAQFGDKQPREIFVLVNVYLRRTEASILLNFFSLASYSGLVVKYRAT